MIDTLNLLVVALLVASCGADGSGNGGGGYGGCIDSNEEPLDRAGDRYHVSAAAPGLEHLVGAVLTYRTPNDGPMQIEYSHEGVDYVVSYDVWNAY